MPSPYFIAVDPSPFKLRMFFGRRQEIQTISNHLLNGDSVLLVGERRIGMTFLLFGLWTNEKDRSWKDRLTKG